MGNTPMRTVSVKFVLSSDEEERLKNLLPFWHNYVNEEGKRPFKDMTVDELFQTVMIVEGGHVINMQIEAEEWRQAAMSAKKETPAGGAAGESK